MKFRLAFSIAIASKCDILLIDEIFMMGDLDFQQKIFEAIKRLQSQKTITTIICSNSPFHIWQLSTKYYQLNHGKIIKVSAVEIKNHMRSQMAKWRKIHT